MREDLGGSISFVALDHALGELWSKLRITRVDYKPEEGAFWDVLYRWAPDAVREGIGLSVAEALSALLSKYLDCVIAADQQEVESFFGNFVPRSRVKEADQRSAGGPRTGFHPGRQPLPDPIGATQSPGDRQRPRGNEPCEDAHSCPDHRIVPRGLGSPLRPATDHTDLHGSDLRKKSAFGYESVAISSPNNFRTYFTTSSVFSAPFLTP